MAQNTEEQTNFEVKARCEAHSEMASPDNMSIRFVHQIFEEGLPSFESFLSVDESEEIAGTKNVFSFPKKGWISALFEGPPIQTTLYCQDSSNSKDVYLSYYPIKGGKVYLARTDNLSADELDLIGSPSGKSLLQLIPGGEFKNEYKAGKGSPNPYWLQFSVPFHSRDMMTTVIRYRFP
jgi:hypothetical protein